MEKKKKKGGRKPARPNLTEIEIMDILNLYNVQKIPQITIAIQYGITRQTVYKIIQKHLSSEIKRSNSKGFNAKVIENRKSLDCFERVKLIKSDAMGVVELSLAMAKHKIEQTLEVVKEGSEIADMAINIDKLSRLLSTALPYVLAKPDQLEKPTTKNIRNSQTPTMRLNRMMNNSDNNTKWKNQTHLPPKTGIVDH